MVQKNIRIITTIASALLVSPVLGQSISFFSSAFENGVKKYALARGVETVNSTYCDTLTTLDLTGVGITDIRDVVYFPSIKSLDLSNNRISNLEMLCELENLQMLYLNNNDLEDISVLAFSKSSSLNIDVSHNRIKDFAIFAGYSHCEFTIVGKEEQIDPEAEWFKLEELYASSSSEEGYQVYCTVSSNSSRSAKLKVGEVACDVIADGKQHCYVIEGEDFYETTSVIVDNELIDYETFLVPAYTFLYTPGEERMINLGLPDYYSCQVGARYGQVSSEGSTISYQGSAEATEDDLFVRYALGFDIKGYTSIKLIKGLIGDVDQDNDVDDYDLQTLVGILTGKIDISGKARSSINLSLLAADLTGDGLIDVADITALVNILHPAAKE